VFFYKERKNLSYHYCCRNHGFQFGAFVARS